MKLELYERKDIQVPVLYQRRVIDHSDISAPRLIADIFYYFWMTDGVSCTPTPTPTPIQSSHQQHQHSILHPSDLLHSTQIQK